MRITQFARRLGVHPETVLRWERRGVIIPGRDWNGHRRYSEEDLRAAEVLVFGRRAQQHPSGEQGV